MSVPAAATRQHRAKVQTCLLMDRTALLCRPRQSARPAHSRSRQSPAPPPRRPAHQGCRIVKAGFVESLASRRLAHARHCVRMATCQHMSAVFLKDWVIARGLAGALRRADGNQLQCPSALDRWHRGRALLETRGSTPMLAHIWWKCARNAGSRRSSPRCRCANCSRFARNTATCAMGRSIIRPAVVP